MLPSAFCIARGAQHLPPPAGSRSRRHLRRPPADPVSLQVSGGKPLDVRGRRLAEGHSWSPGTPTWHEIGLWACDGGEIAVALRTLRKARGSQDVHRAELFPRMADAVTWLEEFDPTQDLAVELDPSDRSQSTIAVTLRAAALRAQADEVARQWRALLGELLYRLDGRH
jgi:hypothetical protein